MRVPGLPRDSRPDRPSRLPLSRLLALLAAASIACGMTSPLLAQTEDKAKPGVEAPAKEKATDAAAKGKPTVDAQAKAAAPTVAVAPSVTKGPTVTITTDTTTDSSDTKSSEPNPPKRSIRHRGQIQIGDDDFDSFNEALHTAPWVVGMAFMVAGTIFLTPIILLFGIIWYKLRKTRLQNDAVLKLAEKGVMPSAQAVDAVMSGMTPQAAAAAASPSAAAPVYEHAVIARRKAVWSDLRRGVILCAIGLAFVFYSMINSSEANWVGLLLLFLGVGYILLWWFEDRHLQRREAGIRAGTDVGKS